MKLLKLQLKMPKLFLSWISLLILFFVPKINLGKNLLKGNYLEDVQISIITCDPGEEIYSLFGHSALRINHQKENKILSSIGEYSNLMKTNYPLDTNLQKVD